MLGRSTQVLVPVLLQGLEEGLEEHWHLWGGAAVTQQIWKQQLVRKTSLLPWVLDQFVFSSGYPFALETMEELRILKKNK